MGSWGPVGREVEGGERFVVTPFAVTPGTSGFTGRTVGADCVGVGVSRSTRPRFTGTFQFTPPLLLRPQETSRSSIVGWDHGSVGVLPESRGRFYLRVLPMNTYPAGRPRTRWSIGSAAFCRS